MAKYFVLGEAETKKLWLVDVEGGGVEPLSLGDLPPAFAEDKGLAQLIKAAREQNVTAIKGVDIALSIDSRSDAATTSLSENSNKKQ
jgi:hypothetical protein